MRDYIVFYLNGKLQKIYGEDTNITLAHFLRRKKALTGTKIVCSEGDCGACSVLIGRLQTTSDNQFDYVPINSCVVNLYSLDLSHIITVEGTQYNEVSKQMANCHGAQCGYCTPGFICVATSLVERCKKNKRSVDEKAVKNYLTGNLCRCTGYTSIIDSITSVELSKYQELENLYNSEQILQELRKFSTEEVLIEQGEFSFCAPLSIDVALDFTRKKQTKVVAGATDIQVVANKTGKDPKRVLSLKNITSLYEISEDNENVLIGANVNLHEIQDKLNKVYPEFCRMINIFASPQIKNKATLAGNIANGSPIGDSMPFLFVAQAKLVLQNASTQREVAIEDFYIDYKKFDIKPDEIIIAVKIPKLKNKVIKLYKVSARKDLDISAVTFAASFELKNKKIHDVLIAYGGVGPIIKRLPEVEKKIMEENFSEAENLVSKSIAPISDLRGSEKFRKVIATNLLKKCFFELREENLL